MNVKQNQAVGNYRAAESNYCETEGNYYEAKSDVSEAKSNYYKAKSDVSQAEFGVSEAKSNVYEAKSNYCEAEEDYYEALSNEAEGNYYEAERYYRHLKLDFGGMGALWGIRSYELKEKGAANTRLRCGGFLMNKEGLDLVVGDESQYLPRSCFGSLC
jgi:hypothetical protein